jgi:putative hemolysin
VSSDIVGSIVLLAVLMILSTYFSATETSITAAGKGSLLTLSDKYQYRKKDFLWLINNTPKAINVTLIGNNLVNIASSAVATSLAISLFGALGMVYAVAVMTILIVVFCEILPKNIAIARKNGILLFSLPFLRLFSFILTPVTAFLFILLKGLGKVLGMNLVSYSSLISREEIDHIVAESGAAGELEEEERKMIHSVIAFEETRVSEVMSPRVDIFSISENDTAEDAVAIFTESGHSRIPVHKEDIDDITGILYAKDLLAPLAADPDNISIPKLMRKALFLPETMKTDEALDIMRKSKVHIAIVVEEYGGTAGLVTLEDLLEEIVGDIQDEYDSESPEILAEQEGVYLVQAQVNLEDLSEAVGYHFDTYFEEVDTLGGMILTLSGNFPTQGQVIAFGPWDISVVEVKNHRIVQVRLKYNNERDDAPVPED